MAIASITTWLTSPNKSYVHGRALYQQYGDDKLVLTIINSGSSSYHFSKLHEALDKLNAQSNLEPKRITFVAPPPPEPDVSAGGTPGAISKVKTNLDVAPPEIRAIRDDKNLMHAEARHLHTMLRLMDSKEHRLEAALKILDNMDKVNESWVAMDEWERTGVITKLQQEETIKAVNELSTQELFKEIKNLPSSISKARKRYNDNTDPKKKTKALAKVHSLVARQSEVKRRIDELV